MIFANDFSPESQLELVYSRKGPVLCVSGNASKVVRAEPKLLEVQHFLPVAPAVRAPDQRGVNAIEPGRRRIEHARPALPRVYKMRVLGQDLRAQCDT